MGTDIYVCIENKTESGTWRSIGDVDVDRNYGMFAWLSGVLNYSGIVPISDKRGIPDDAAQETKLSHERWGEDAHSASWLSVDELFAVDYNQFIEDRRCMVKIAYNVVSGAGTCEPGEGKLVRLGEFLGDVYFEFIKMLKEMGVDRIVFWFDC